MLKYIFLFNCVLFSFLAINVALAQEKDTVSVAIEEKEPKEPFEFYLHSIKVGGDISYPILMGFNGNLVRFEANSEFNFSNRFILTADVGYSDNTSVPETLEFEYKNTGFYARVGMDYNLMHNKFKDNAIFIGLRYGQANFEHSLSYNLDSTVWSTDPTKLGSIQKSETGLKVSWVELTTGLRVRVWKSFYTGYTLRVQFRTSLKDGEVISAKELPGFGSNNSSSNLRFNYHIFYQLPFGRNSKKIKAENLE
jgi:hypothetical protein